MVTILGIRFKNTGKIYYFDPGELVFSKGEYAVVETSRGIECGEVAIANRQVPDEQIVSPLKGVVRKATPEDVKRVEENADSEKHAFEVALKKIAEHKLEMKLIDVEITFDKSKILFYFTADGRVDFRELVKDLASVFRTRIELRQIGVRDESKMMGGLGICGQPFCCHTFLAGFQPVSIKMAKDQGLSLNPAKISGSCGRLMCCLKYEQNAYEDLLRTTPSAGSYVKTKDGEGVVCDVSLLTGMLKVRLNGAVPDAPQQSYHKDEVKLLRPAGKKQEKNSKESDAGEELM